MQDEIFAGNSKHRILGVSFQSAGISDPAPTIQSWSRRAAQNASLHSEGAGQSWKRLRAMG